MKITKILCDICKKEITYRDLTMTITTTFVYPVINTGPSSKTIEDICMNCQDEINETINLLKR